MNLIASILFLGTLSFATAFPEAPSVGSSGLSSNNAPMGISLTDTEILDSCARKLSELQTDSSSTEEEYRKLIRVIETVQPGDSLALTEQKELLVLAHAAFNELLSAVDTLVTDSLLGFSVFELPSDSLVNDSLDAEALLAKDTLALSSFPQPYRSANLPPIPIVLNHDVQDGINFFLSKGKKVMQRWLDRSATVIPELMPHIREEGFPDEIIFLCMIESGFNYHAYSRAKASGPWQFISGTGRRYKLKINKWYDERRDPELSTHASMAYLRDLYGMFGDWYLVMAAYNCGENRIERLRKIYGDDFWTMKKLPRQTRNYVPTYLAARIIFENPETYGFWKPDPIPPEPTDVVYLNQCIPLKELAECAGIDYEIFKMMNPAFLKTTTPPNGDSVRVRLPAGSIANGFWDRYASIRPSKHSSIFATHIVKKGETIGGIARKYGVSVEEIVENSDNNIGRNNLIHIGQVLTIGGVLAADTKSKSKPKPTEVEVAVTPGTHRVADGETLIQIAKRYSLKVEDLASANDRRIDDVLQPGQVLNIRPSPRKLPDITHRKVETAAISDEGAEHLVVSGDTLWYLARRYGVTVDALRRANGLHPRSKLKLGQRLSIPTRN